MMWIEKIIALSILFIFCYWIFDSIKYGKPLPRYKGMQVDFWNVRRKRKPVREIKNVFGIKNDR